jgi:hypothetical protein
VNVVASVLARLRNHSKSNGAPFQQVLQQYAIERFLYRISKSKHAQTVILEGALLLKTIGIPRARPTVDIDMSRQKGNREEDRGRIIGTNAWYILVARLSAKYGRCLYSSRRSNQISFLICAQR